jgi:hypothetical protein
MMEADAQAELDAGDRRQRVDLRLHLGGGAGGGVGGGKDAHHLVADRLDDAPAARFGGSPGCAQAGRHGFEARGISRRLIETRAAAHVGKKHGALPLRHSANCALYCSKGFRHCATFCNPCRLRPS